MSGRHEPPSDGSFYFSLATSTLRFALIVALVVGGVVLIDQAFPQDGTAAQRPRGGSTSPSPRAGAAGPVATATVYYPTAGDRIEAEALAENVFPELDVKISRLTDSQTNVEQRVQVAIYLGTDYAAQAGYPPTPPRHRTCSGHPLGLPPV